MCECNLKIREAREALNMSQRDLAKAIGISPNTLCGYETGLHDPKSDQLVRIAKTLHTTVDFLLGITDSNSAHTNSSMMLTDDELHLINTFRCLTDAAKGRLLGYADGIAESNKKETYQNANAM